jgi:signal transduction histidine kinase/DNA-binding response OmpR family regulator
MISLAAIHPYSPQAIRLIEDLWVTLNARVTGILAFQQIQTLARQLEQQNRELDTQKNELSAQAMELNQQNIELERQKTQLGEASRLKTSFISNMSHELRTPLNSVIALSGVLNRRLANQIPEEEYSYLEVIERNGKQLLALINDVLDLSRIESGHEEVEVSQFDINDLVAEVVSIISPLAQQKPIELLHRPDPGLPLLASDLSKCRHILQNLVNNAVKFTDAGRVEITLEQKDSSIQINVSDTGIGISKDHLPFIFDEFRQADSSTSRRFGGTGLGLAIAKKYVQMLGGSIFVRSVLGEGSTFTLSLPFHTDPDSPARKVKRENIYKTPVGTGQPISPSGWKASIQREENQDQKTILIVEDSEPAVIQLKDILEQHAYQTLVARNGSEALEIIQNTTLPDAMILDLMMPGVDGFGVLKTVRESERTAHLPVLILTAKHITQDELKFLKHNHVQQLIQKGDINRTELLNAVAAMVTPGKEKIERPKPALQTIEGKPVVLVVEDNPDNMLTVKALLSEEFRIIEAADGQAAVNQARQHVPHLILMDVALPLMDGIHAFNTIRNDPDTQHIPVIALTASAMTSDRETILAYGFDGYIPKPIDQMEMIYVIQQVLYGK